MDIKCYGEILGCFQKLSESGNEERYQKQSKINIYENAFRVYIYKGKLNMTEQTTASGTQ